MSRNRRCHSASAVRKRLQAAVEQSTFATKLEQLEALRRLGRKQSASPTIGAGDRQLFYQYQNQYEPEMLTRGDALSSSTRLVRSSSGVPIHPLHRPSRTTQSHAGIPSSTTASESSSAWRRPSSAAPTAGGASTAIIGGYKSSSVQMEVELAERLNEIERFKVRRSWSLLHP